VSHTATPFFSTSAGPSQVETLTDDISFLDVFSYIYGAGGGVVMVDETGALHRQVNVHR
jgi:hypothetical protein